MKRQTLYATATAVIFTAAAWAVVATGLQATRATGTSLHGTLQATTDGYNLQPATVQLYTTQSPQQPSYSPQVTINGNELQGGK